MRSNVVDRSDVMLRRYSVADSDKYDNGIVYGASLVDLDLDLQDATRDAKDTQSSEQFTDYPTFSKGMLIWMLMHR